MPLTERQRLAIFGIADQDTESQLFSQVLPPSQIELDDVMMSAANTGDIESAFRAKQFSDTLQEDQAEEQSLGPTSLREQLLKPESQPRFDFSNIQDITNLELLRNRRR